MVALTRLMRSRRAISLLEVLISIGVLAIGLLGVVALIPIASEKAAQGARQNAVASYGRRAFREFAILDLQSAAKYQMPIRGANQFGDVFASPGQWNSARRAFVLDPVGYALVNNNITLSDPIPNNAATPHDDRNILSFPYGSQIGTSYASTDISLVRLRLNGSIAGGLAMTPSAVQHSFLFADDLNFDLPGSSAEFPEQTALSGVCNGLPQPLALKRNSDGEFSWFATLVPASTDSNVYQLSVAIVRQRNAAISDAQRRVTLEVHNDATINPAGDRTVATPFVTSFTSYGGSGEMVLSSSVEIKPGEWLMVMNGKAGSVDPSFSSSGVPFKPQYEWYRVISSSISSQDLDGNGIVDTLLSVSGATWTTPVGLAFPAAASIANPPVAAIVPQVVAVYSKTITLNN